MISGTNLHLVLILKKHALKDSLHLHPSLYSALIKFQKKQAGVEIMIEAVNLSRNVLASLQKMAKYIEETKKIVS